MSTPPDALRPVVPLPHATPTREPAEVVVRRVSPIAGRTGGKPVPFDGRMIVTIDGPAGTGKSSVARDLAIRLGLQFLDTGAMYRVAAAIAMERHIPLGEVPTLLEAVREAKIHFDWTTDPPTIMAFERPYDDRIRTQAVTGVVSRIAGIGPLREVMVTKQRQIASRHPLLVTEGRDQGSVAFPDADVKIYLDASPETRARRRAVQLRASGEEADEGFILREITRRDASDRTRADGPLICPSDAVVVDTTGLAQHEVVDRLERIVRSRQPAAGGTRPGPGPAP